MQEKQAFIIVKNQVKHIRQEMSNQQSGALLKRKRAPASSATLQGPNTAEGNSSE